MIPVLLEGITVPWHSVFWEDIAISPASAAWIHGILGCRETPEKLRAFFVLVVEEYLQEKCKLCV